MQKNSNIGRGLNLPNRAWMHENLEGVSSLYDPLVVVAMSLYMNKHIHISYIDEISNKNTEILWCVAGCNSN